MSALLKSTYFLGSIGTTGVGATATTGWFISDFISTRSLTFWYTPNVYELGLYRESSTATFGNYDCMKNFFPRIYVNHTSPFDANAEQEVIEDYTSLLVSPPEDIGSANPMGCALMQLAQDLNKPQWAFQAEITARNDRIGWILSIAGQGNNSKTDEDGKNIFSQNMQHRLILLEKQWWGWRIMAGYEWYGNGFEDKRLSIHVTTPERKTWINEHDSAGASQKSGSDAQLDQYFGVWEINEELSGQEVFEGFEIWNQEKKYSEILGSLSGVLNIDTDNHRISGGYRVSDGKWVKYKKKEQGDDHVIDIVPTLKAWYKPFKGKRGMWKDFIPYCKKNKGYCLDIQ